jgi:hypothetical protein
LATTCNVVLTAPAFIPVNADDDNGSQVTNGIPAQRDFDVAPIPNNGQGDPELKAASVTVNGNVPGELSWSVNQTGTGKIALWTDNQKSAPVAGAWQVPANPPTYSFYIEGQHESAALKDVTLTFTFTWNITGTPQTDTKSQDITVNPLINYFIATPAARDTGQNVRFTHNNQDGSVGLQALTPAPANLAGIVFRASVNNTYLPGALTLVQNYESLTNGALGTVYPPPPAPNSAPVGWLYAANTVDPNTNQPIGAANLVVQDGAPFPLLDVLRTATAPDYEFGSTVRNTPTPPPGNYTIATFDAPTTGHPVQGPSGTKIDLRSTWTMWLLWRYHNTVANQDTLVYYPIAEINWKVDWLAHASTNNGNTPPIDTIDIPHGVTADTSYSPTNDPPDTMSPTTTVNGRTVSNRFDNNSIWVTTN